jgi:hypothetical protein
MTKTRAALGSAALAWGFRDASGAAGQRSSIAHRVRGSGQHAACPTRRARDSRTRSRR